MFLPPNIKNITAALCARPSDNRPNYVDGHKVSFLARGTFGDVWAIDTYVAKIYRDRKTGFDARMVMREEWEPYKALGASHILPRFYDCEEFPHAPCQATLGWALLEKIDGQQPAIDEEMHTEALWGQRFAKTAAAFEQELQNAPAPPAFWKNDDLARRMRGELKMKSARSDEMALANKLRNIIAEEIDKTPGCSRYLHGDLQFLNSLWDGTNIRLIDPGISYEPPEANLKRLPHHTDFVDAFAAEYERQTGIALNRKLLWAISALDQHEIYLRLIHLPTGEDPAPMRKNRDVCLENLGGDF